MLSMGDNLSLSLSLKVCCILVIAMIDWIAVVVFMFFVVVFFGFFATDFVLFLLLMLLLLLFFLVFFHSCSILAFSYLFS